MTRLEVTLGENAQDESERSKGDFLYMSDFWEGPEKVETIADPIQQIYIIPPRRDVWNFNACWSRIIYRASTSAGNWKQSWSNCTHQHGN